MKAEIPAWLILAFIAALLAVGIPYWSLPYNKLNLPDALLGPGLIVVGLAALLLRLFAVAPFWRIAKFMAASVPAVVMLRVIVDAMRDPTSHNLWPFELVIAILVGICCAIPGALVGALLAKLVRLQDDGESR